MVTFNPLLTSTESTIFSELLAFTKHAYSPLSSPASNELKIKYAVPSVVRSCVTLVSNEEVSKFPFLVQAILTVIGMSAASTTTAVQLIRRGVPGSSRTLVSVSAITETDGGGTEEKRTRMCEKCDMSLSVQIGLTFN